MSSDDWRRRWRVLLLAVGLLLAAPMFEQPVSAAPTLVSAATTQLDWVATSPDGAQVTLDGSASSDDAVLFAWWEDCPVIDCGSGTRLTEDSADAKVATVQLAIGAHQIYLWAADDDGDWVAAEPITVTISVPAPVANAGDDQTVSATSDAGADVALDGIGSANVSAYSWSVNGTQVAMDAAPTVTLPLGVNDVTLTVTGWDGETTATDSVSVTVNPVAVAGDDQTVASENGADAEVTLDGTGSLGNLNTIVWTDAGNNEIATGTNPTVTLPVGVQQITLTISGPGSVSDTDSVTISIAIAPEANAGDDQTMSAETEDGAAVTLDPVRGTVNANVDFSIAFFPPDTAVQIDWIRTSGGTIDLGMVTTDANGSATGTIRVPATPGGANQVRFTSGETSTTADFDIAPRIKVTPETVIPGQSVSVSLRGFDRQENVRVRWLVNSRYVELTTVTTSNTGSANINVHAPTTAPAGSTSVRGDGTAFRAQTNAVAVVAPAGEPAVTLSPARGTVNTHADFAISNFPANTMVSIVWERTSGSLIDLGAVDTDDTGAATGTIRVPATPGGDQVVHFTSGAITVAASYEVAPRIKVLGSGAIGDQVSISLRGFGKNEQMRIRWFADGRWLTVGVVTTSNTGSAHVTVTIPVGADTGYNAVRGDGTVFHAQTNVALVEN